jgi:hypothetical protein
LVAVPLPNEKNTAIPKQRTYLHARTPRYSIRWGGVAQNDTAL